MRTFDKLAWQRIRRKNNNNLWTKKYEKTKKGFLVRCYRNMLSRVKGISKPHLYFGKGILDKPLFYQWSLLDTSFNHLFTIWEQSQFERRLTPSIDRINPDYGYLPKNIRWITFSENCQNTRRNKFDES